MFSSLAPLFPLISPPSLYKKEAEIWMRVIHQELGDGRHRLLDLGVGGAHYLSHFAADFDVTGVDISPMMLENAAKLIPAGDFRVGDMRDIRLGTTFDAVLLHDAVSHMATEEDLSQTFRTARSHLRPGGKLLVAPDYFIETYSGTNVVHNTASDGKTEVTFIECLCDPVPGDGQISATRFIIICRDGKVYFEHDRYVLGLFGKEAWARLLGDAGFEVRWEPYDVFDDHREGYLLVGTLLAGECTGGTQGVCK
jgi:hypothetical protein